HEDPKLRGDRNLYVNRLEVQGPGDPSEVRSARFLNDAGGMEYGGRGRILVSDGEVGFDHEFPEEGEYRIRVRAFGQQAGPDPARMAFKIDGKTVAVSDVPATEAEPGTYELRLLLEPGKHADAASFPTRRSSALHEDPRLRGDRNLIIE